MHITVFGATGQVGRRVLAEARQRGHAVTAVVRDPGHAASLPSGVTVRGGDLGDPAAIDLACSGQDVIVHAARPADSDDRLMARMTRRLLLAADRHGARLLVAGGAASLSVPGTGGRLLLDDPRFLAPPLRPVGLASLAQYRACQSWETSNWTYFSPAAELFPGRRSGVFRLGRDELLLDGEGRSRLSLEDAAVALLDEVEDVRHPGGRFTAAY